MRPYWGDNMNTYVATLRLNGEDIGIDPFTGEIAESDALQPGVHLDLAIGVPDSADGLMAGIDGTTATPSVSAGQVVQIDGNNIRLFTARFAIVRPPQGDACHIQVRQNYFVVALMSRKGKIRTYHFSVLPFMNKLFFVEEARSAQAYYRTRTSGLVAPDLRTEAEPALAMLDQWPGHGNIRPFSTYRSLEIDSAELLTLGPNEVVILERVLTRGYVVAQLRSGRTGYIKVHDMGTSSMADLKQFLRRGQVLSYDHISAGRQQWRRFRGEPLRRRFQDATIVPGRVLTSGR